MSAEERATVSLGLAQGHSPRTLARIWGRAPSPVSREVTQNPTPDCPSRACTAQRHADIRAHHPRRSRKLRDPWL
ncbi:MAG: hypothetical protein CCU26_13530 [Nitrospira sp. UW-LDO-01]|nr:MAG: hypothetical protein CCU26_13530 [Nitrospira sp. UW-LDO-01]